MKIAIDAMGGDHAPVAIVEGAVEAAREHGIEIILVGDKDSLSRELSKYNITGLSLSLRHASQIIEMEDPPLAPLRKKKDSSIRVAAEMVKRKEAAAFISAGHTGATMATAFYTFGPLPGVERPAIATFLPTLKGVSIMLDVGATVDCKPVHLLQFALMGDIYCKEILNKEEPKVGLLSIGEEDIKGNELTRESFKLLKSTDINFIGNVDGKDVFSGKADVIVCDGFIGNIALKISEGLADAITKMLKREIADAPSGRFGYFLLKSAFKNFRKRTDYSEYGGAPLLGVNGICIIGHGRSSSKAITNAVQVAVNFSKSGINEKISKKMSSLFQTRKIRRATK
ncbi:MAG: phosphate acyltransferase PlsX [Nitrospirota bacterium]